VLANQQKAGLVPGFGALLDAMPPVGGARSYPTWTHPSKRGGMQHGPRGGPGSMHARLSALLLCADSPRSSRSYRHHHRRGVGPTTLGPSRDLRWRRIDGFAARCVRLFTSRAALLNTLTRTRHHSPTSSLSTRPGSSSIGHPPLRWSITSFVSSQWTRRQPSSSISKATWSRAFVE